MNNYDLDGVCQDCIYLEKIRPLFEEKDKKIETLEKGLEYAKRIEKYYKTKFDKAIEYNNHLIEHAKYHLNLGHLKKMKKILEGSDK